MDGMKLSGSNRNGVLPQNSASFDPSLQSGCQIVTQLSSKYVMTYGLTPMGHGMLLGHPNNNHWRCMDGMKLSSSNRYGVMPQNSVSFGRGLLSGCQIEIVTQLSSK
jgi:uncharacterized protein (DUF1015 family)